MTGGNETRISELRTKAAGLGAMLDGCLQVKRNRVVNKDGSAHTSPEHYQFQYRGADGRLRWKSVPGQHCGKGRRLIAKGREYRRVEREYAALVSEDTLAGLGKKTPDAEPAPAGVGERRGRPAGAGGGAPRRGRRSGGRGAG